jgi:hypothetical protein
MDRTWLIERILLARVEIVGTVVESVKEPIAIGVRSRTRRIGSPGINAVARDKDSIVAIRTEIGRG